LRQKLVNPPTYFLPEGRNESVLCMFLQGLSGNMPDNWEFQMVFMTYKAGWSEDLLTKQIFTDSQFVSPFREKERMRIGFRADIRLK
jgi:hypothetical protein